MDHTYTCLRKFIALIRIIHWECTFGDAGQCHLDALVGITILIPFILHYSDVIMGNPNHQPHDCLLNCLFGRRSKKTSKLRVTGLCVGNSPGTGEFPAQMASNAENVSIWWRHHDLCHCTTRMGVCGFTAQGWGLLSQFPPFRYFPNFSDLLVNWLSMECHLHIWQMSP